MPRNYKIYFKEKLLLPEQAGSNIEREGTVVITETQDFISLLQELSLKAGSEDIRLEYSGPFDEVLNRSCRLVEAGGGLVFSEKGDLLLIERFGLWDLPKGKLKKGESPSTGALREVREETGLHKLMLLRESGCTYHIYYHKNAFHLKKTHWFFMRHQGNETPVPQAEEHITKVAWFDHAAVQLVMRHSYRSLREFLQEKVLQTGRL